MDGIGSNFSENVSRVCFRCVEIFMKIGCMVKEIRDGEDKVAGESP